MRLNSYLSKIGIVKLSLYEYRQVIESVKYFLFRYKR